MKPVLFLIAIILATGTVSAINLSANETYHFAYNNTNTTDNVTITTTLGEDFYCAANTTNTSVPACLNNTLNITLNPGQTLNATNDTCSVLATCTQAPSSACSVTTTLTGGQSYVNNGGSCNLSINCQNQAVVCNATPTTSFTNIITLTSNGQVITFNFNGQLQQFPITNGTFSNYFQQTYECPVIIQNVTSNPPPGGNITATDMFEYCKQAQPYLLSWVDDQLKQSTKNQDAYNACVIKETEAENGCQARVDAEHSQIVNCQNQLNNSQTTLNNCYDDKAAAENTNGITTIVIILLSILTTLAVVSSIIGWVLYVKQRRKHKEVEE